MTTMRSGGMCVGFLAAALSTGCVARDMDAGEEMADAFRSGGFPTPPNYPGNGDITLYAGVGTTSADCLIYDFVGPNVHDGAAPGGPVIATVVGSEIQVPGGGEVLCSVEGDTLVDRVIVGGAGGEVLFTSFGRWVFEGELDFEGDNLAQIAQELVDQLAFTFQGPHIYDGLHFHGDIAVTSTKPLTHATMQRKLVIAAMLTGECGGLGIPEDEDEDGEHDQ